VNDADVASLDNATVCHLVQEHLAKSTDTEKSMLFAEVVIERDEVLQIAHDPV
jgi:hypothetical protein